MAQTGYTPIQLYYSTTASATPTAGNLAAGELALNTADEKLYFKNSSGTVKLLASSAGSSGSVTSVSVVSANGLSGTVANSTTTPAITLSTSISGILKGNGTSISAATSGTDYAPATSGSSILYGNGAGGFSNVTVGSGLSFASGTLTSTGSGGTVTQVAQTFNGGLISVSGSPINTTGTLALAVAGTSGGIPYFSSGTTWASSAALAANSLVKGGGAGVAPSTITTGTGVLTALGVNVGSSGAFVTNGGALGTPSSGTLTNATGLPIDGGTTGTLPASRGGTGLTTPGTAGNVLTSNGSAWVSQAVASGGALVRIQNFTFTNVTAVSTGLNITSTYGRYLLVLNEWYDSGGSPFQPFFNINTALYQPYNVNDYYYSVSRSSSLTSYLSTSGASAVPLTPSAFSGSSAGTSYSFSMFMDTTNPNIIRGYWSGFAVNSSISGGFSINTLTSGGGNIWGFYLSGASSGQMSGSFTLYGMT